MRRRWTNAERVEDVKSDEEKEDEEHTWLRPDLGDGGVDEEDDDEHDERPTKKPKKKEKSARVTPTMRTVCARKRKYKSLRERKSEARKAAKADAGRGGRVHWPTSDARDGVRGRRAVLRRGCGRTPRPSR